jgi:hypothetical protein
MSAISKEQFLALTYGVLIKKDGSTDSTTFTAVNGASLLNAGVEGLATTTNLLTTDSVVVVANTAGIFPGMSVIRVAGAGAFYTTHPVVVYSVDSATQITLGSFAQRAETNLEATLVQGESTVTLTSGTTRRLEPGMKLTKISGGGAFNTTNAFVKAILNDRQFTVVTTVDTSNVPGASPATHQTSGAVLFYAGGIVRNNSTAGAITSFTVGGINLTNNQVPGTGDPTPQVFSLANATNTIGTDLVCLVGGDISNNGALGNEEKDYHYTGQILRRKLK